MTDERIIRRATEIVDSRTWGDWQTDAVIAACRRCAIDCVVEALDPAGHRRRVEGERIAALSCLQYSSVELPLGEDPRDALEPYSDPDGN